MPRAFITGCAGYELTRDEFAFISQARPFGLILFDRNCRSPQQVRTLVRAFRDAAGQEDAPVLIDQEGGRVQRLKPPHWPALPPAGVIGALYGQDRLRGRDAAHLLGRVLAGMLAPLGINVNCMPLLDVPVSGGHEIIGNRAFAGDGDIIIDAARAFMDGLMAGGCLPVIKHIPGHGRAGCDSHKALPIVQTGVEELQRTDFRPFRALNTAPFAMTAHVVYSAIDPDHPATTSPRIVHDIIRRSIGFSGLLMSDDLSMEALSGSMRHRAAAAFAAGCDLALHCNGELEQMEAVADEAPELGESALALYAEACGKCGHQRREDDLLRYLDMVAGLEGV